MFLMITRALDSTLLKLVNLYMRLLRRENYWFPLAANSWDVSTGDPQIDPDIYDDDKGLWLSEEGAPIDEPDVYYAYLKMHEKIKISEDRMTGLIQITLDAPTPMAAKIWLQWLVEDINEYFRKIDIADAEQAVSYLMEKMNADSYLSVKSVLAGLIEQQTRILMLANSKREYVYKTLDPPFQPKFRVSPRRTVIVLGLTALGGLLLAVVVFLIHWSGYELTFRGIIGIVP